MRDYAKVSPSFWTGETGKKIRALDSCECQLIALYLMTSPHSNMLGLYYIPLPLIAHETGRPIEGVSKALRSLNQVGFSTYDQESEWVWVPEMAKYQIGESLKAGDKKVKGIAKKYHALPKNPFLYEFYQRYKDAYHLTEPRGKPQNPKKSTSPIEAPSKPHRSQEQEQEQEQDKKDQRSSPAAKADSSKHFSEKVGPPFIDRILKSCKQLETLSQTNGKRINPYQWVQQKVGHNVHPQAITESLDGLVQYWDSTSNPWGYIESIFKTKNQNYNERQHMAQAKEFASAWRVDPKVKALMSDFGSMPS